jgi:hypothetical protein
MKKMIKNLLIYTGVALLVAGLFIGALLLSNYNYYGTFFLN